MEFMKFDLTAMSDPKTLEDVEALLAEVAFAVEDLIPQMDRCYAAMHKAPDLHSSTWHGDMESPGRGNDQTGMASPGYIGRLVDGLRGPG